MAHAQPVLVRAYTTTSEPHPRRDALSPSRALPPIASFAFADVLRSVDGPDFQHAISGIADIYARSRLSLADEYAAHLPPLGEITAADSRGLRKDVLRASGGKRGTLTSVPEGSSGSSEGSRKSRLRTRGVGFGGLVKVEEIVAPRWGRMRIGRMGRMVSVTSTTAVASDLGFPADVEDEPARTAGKDLSRLRSSPRNVSKATLSLRRLLAVRRPVEPV